MFFASPVEVKSFTSTSSLKRLVFSVGAAEGLGEAN